MKKLDKVILTLFSVLIFLQSIMVICIILGWINIEMLNKFVILALKENTSSKIILVSAIICLLCSLKAIFFESPEKNTINQGILMQNDNGKLLISKPTLESIVISVLKEFSDAEDVDVMVELDSTNNVIVNITLNVNKDVVIKELTLNIQNKVRERIKKTSDLEVKAVNVKVKNVAIEKNEK